MKRSYSGCKSLAKRSRKSNNFNSGYDPSLALIQEVKKQTILYNTAHPNYKDADKRTTAWNHISSVMNMAEGECQNKWSALRRCLANAINRQKKRSSEGRSTKSWRYQREMSFLVPYLNVKDDQQHLDSSSDDESSNKGLDTENLSYVHQSDDSNDIPYSVEIVVDSIQVASADEDSNIVEEEILVNENDEEVVTKKTNTNSSCKEGDKDDTIHPQLEENMDKFFRRVSREIKKRPTAEQFNLRSSIYQLVTEAQKRCFLNETI